MNNSQHKVDFKAKQAEFSAYIRDPVNNLPPADVDKKRIETYRELFFNNINSFLGSHFPVLRKILNNQQWHELAQDFFANHANKTPFFSEIPEEFLYYLQNERHIVGDFPFLLELAHYEWVEMALSISKEQFLPIDASFIAELQQQKLSLSKLAWPLAYQYPVQQISPSFLPESAPDQATYLVVYRDKNDDVHFMQINAMTFRLLQIIQQQEGVDCAESLQQLVTESIHPNPQVLLEGGLQTLQELARKGIIIPVV